MSLSYVKLFADTGRAVDLLSNEEAGRLFKAILHGINGEVDELPGQEKLVYAMLKAQFERDEETYERYCDKQQKNGKKGGRPKKPSGFSENPENPTVILEKPKNPTENPETQKSQEKDKDYNKEKDKDKEEEKDNNHYLYNNGAVTDEVDKIVNSDNPFGTDTGHRPDPNTVYAYASQELQSLGHRAMQEIQSFVDDTSEEVVRHAIDNALDQGVRTWSYVRSILNSYVDEGIKTVGEAKAYDDKRRKEKSKPSQRSQPCAPHTTPEEEEQKRKDKEFYDKVFASSFL